MANEVATKNNSPIAIAANKIANIYISDLSNLNEAVGVPMTEESKRCAVNAVMALCADMGADVVQQLPRAQLVQVLQFVSLNGLDVFSGQVFLDKRFNKKTGTWSVKATPMGSAYEIMTQRYGANVKTVHPARVVHEGDEFELPQFDGLEMTPVHFKPTLKGLDGKAIAVYYLIEKTDGTLDFAIATREGVARNLMAQILNATLREEGINRRELMAHLAGKTLDELLNDEYLAKWISPAYRSPSSCEMMIIGKMKKNALLHYTRDLGSAAYAKVAPAIEEAEGTDMVKREYVDVESVQNPQIATKVNDFEVEEPEAEVEIKPEPGQIIVGFPADETTKEEAPKPEEPKPEEKPIDTDPFGIDDL